MIPLIKSILMTLIIGSLFGDRPYVVVLGIAQDGGAPHAGCEKSCCIEPVSYTHLRAHET